MTRWRANVAMLMWLLLFAATILTTRVPYIAPLSFVVVVLIAWDYGFRPALLWIALVHVLFPTGLYLLEMGPFFVFVEARELVATIMAVTLLTVIGLAYLTERVHSLTRELQDSQSNLTQVNDQLQAALDEVKELQGLLSICAWCKHIRDDTGEWEQLESFITRNSRATFTHGLCPKCLEEQMQTLKK
jgi:hypothetical protein